MQSQSEGQSAESAIELGRELQRHQIAGLKNRGSCSIPTAPTNLLFLSISYGHFLYQTHFVTIGAVSDLAERLTLSIEVRMDALLQRRANVKMSLIVYSRSREG